MGSSFGLTGVLRIVFLTKFVKKFSRKNFEKLYLDYTITITKLKARQEPTKPTGMITSRTHRIRGNGNQP